MERTIRLKDYLNLLRVNQWIKNLLIFAPLIFSKHLFEPYKFLSVLIYCLSFCLSASFIYIINDIFDRESDKLHPVKKNRPLASGKISIKKAIIISLLLFVFSIVMNLFYADYYKRIILNLSYIVLMISYTIILKKVVIIDIMIVAIGFILRVIFGGIILNVEVSVWIILCTFLLALLIVTGKRRWEILELTESKNHREVLQNYNVDFLDKILLLSAMMSFLCYTLYTVAPQTIDKFKTDLLWITSFFVFYGIVRYLYLIYVKKLGGSPVELFIKDIGLKISIFLWIIVFGILIY